MATPIFEVPEVATSVLTFATLNVILRHYEAIGENRVIDFRTTPPGSPADGDAYIVNPSPTGLWTGKEDYIAFSVSGAWYFLKPVVGRRIFVEDLRCDAIYQLNGDFHLVPTAGHTTLTANANGTFNTYENITITASNSGVTMTALEPTVRGSIVVYNDTANAVTFSINSSTVSVPANTLKTIITSTAGTFIS